MSFKRGDHVIKDSGDYTFEGTVLCPIIKLSGLIRYAVEDSRGIVLVMSDKQIRKLGEG